MTLPNSDVDQSPELNRQNLGVLVDDIQSKAGPGEATKRYNQTFIETFRANDGQMPNDLEKYPWMLLTTTGARSGTQRTVPLMFFERDDRFFIIASKGGAVAHPAWYHNLVAHPEVIAEYGGTYDASPQTVTAAVLSGAERNDVFEWVAGLNATFAGYQARTERLIPVVELRKES